jgi:uncharacterized membrane protein YidH (DUF202 family)
MTSINDGATRRTAPNGGLQPSSAAEVLAGADDRDAQELSPIKASSSIQAEGLEEEQGDCADEEERQIDDALRRHATQSTTASTIYGPGWIGWWRRGWNRHVSLKVSPSGRRDHLGELSWAREAPFYECVVCSHPLLLALERTYLGYLRTSLALSNAGIVFAQLFSLTSSSSGKGGQPKVKNGLPLAVTFIIAAIVVLLLGAIRFWRQQTAMARGKVWAGGFEITLIMFFTIAVSF